VISFYRETQALAEGETIDKASMRRAHGCDAAKMGNGAGIVSIENCRARSEREIKRDRKFFSK
jgi:hypothetical protein